MAFALDRKVGLPVGTGRATFGVIGIFGSLGVGVGLMAFAAAFTLAEGALVDATTLTGGVFSLVLGALPFLAIPIVALLGGVWAGNVTCEAGRGAVAGAIGGLVGSVLMLLLVGIGFAVGVASAGVTVQDVSVNVQGVPADLQNQFGFIASAAGLTYLFATLLIGALAGAVVGAARPEAYVGMSTSEDVEGRPAPRV